MVKQEEIVSDVIKMKNLYFQSIDFEATGEQADNEGCADVRFKEEHDIKENIIDIKLYSEVEIDGVFVLKICLRGAFEVDNMDSNRILPNAIAIMFPYLRSQVSIMTAQPNIPTISLKPVNINALLEKQKEQEE